MILLILIPHNRIKKNSTHPAQKMVDGEKYKKKSEITKRVYINVGMLNPGIIYSFCFVFAGMTFL